MPELWVYSGRYMENKIVLLGYMGSGKSSVGKQLADDLKVPFIDLDDYIEDQLNMSIPEIFGKKGEIFFRKQEHVLLKEILESKEGAVIALGGGTPVYSRNMDLILDHTEQVFYLKVSIPVLAARLEKEKDHRPLIRHLEDEELAEFIGKHLFERNPFYNQASHILDVGELDHIETAQLIKQYLV